MARGKLFVSSERGESRERFDVRLKQAASLATSHT